MPTPVEQLVRRSAFDHATMVHEDHAVRGVVTWRRA